MKKEMEMVYFMNVIAAQGYAHGQYWDYHVIFQLGGKTYRYYEKGANWNENEISDPEENACYSGVEVFDLEGETKKGWKASFSLKADQYNLWNAVYLMADLPEDDKPKNWENGNVFLKRQSYGPLWPEITVEEKEIYSAEYHRALVKKDGLLLIPMKREEILAMLQAGEKDFRGMDLSEGADLFEGRDLAKAKFQGAYAPGAKFSAVSYADFLSAHMPGATFIGEMDSTNFLFCKLEGARFSGNLKWASFEGSNLRKARFEKDVNVHGTDFAGADLTDAEFPEINAVYTRCWGTFFNNANVEGSTFADLPYMKTMLEGWCKGTPAYSSIDFMDIARLFPRGDRDLMQNFKEKWDREHT